MKMKLSDQTYQVYQDDKDQLVFFGLEGDQVLAVSGAVGEYLNGLDLSQEFDITNLVQEFIKAHGSDYPEQDVKAIFQEIGKNLIDLNLATDG